MPRTRLLIVTITLLLLSAACAAHAVAPSVTNVQATQQQDASRKVKITYNLSDPDSSSVYITVTISTDNGATYSITPSLATGDIGWVRTGGDRTIYWDAKSQYPTGQWANCKAKVTADDASGGVYPGQMIYIPAGSFQMGNSGEGNDWAYSNCYELPQHWVNLPAYYIGKYEVTRGEYAQFKNAGGYSNPAYWSSAGWSWKVSNGRTEPYYWASDQNWGTGTFTQTNNHPVVGVCYYEAEAFCNWAGGHLATEAQWEKATRWTGSHPNVYPWGDVWDQEKCNNYYDSNPAGGGYAGYAKYQTSPVGSYPSGGSPYGCQDMAGNVWEWCQDWYVSYAGSSCPFDYTNSYRVLRGGGWSDSGNFDRCAFRGSYDPDLSDFGVGFRLAR
ncbi:MAG: SUMF1/EgtB/PvdO family nonheme iron enzyme [Armatimonadota bacterium]|nr:SUMF1/EgtB/PvdO family nonheme iron enzyme [Armatimonadota bacterium]